MIIPDAVFSSDNPYDIPLLDIGMQAEYIEPPVKIWGSRSRRQQFTGTWAFYCSDYKFTALWKHPDSIFRTGASIAVEPNFSTSPDMPCAVAIYGIFRKRWLARFWQTNGIKVIVDLCVAEKFMPLNMMGVPEGWGAFATRATRGANYLIEAGYEAAYRKAGGRCPKLFLVYGGGKGVRDMCLSNGWTWIPEQMSEVSKGGK